MKYLLRGGLAAVLLLLNMVLIDAQDSTVSGTPDEICAASPAVEPETRSYEQPETVLEAGVDYRAVFCTDAGAIYLDLLEEYAPLTVNSFVFLAQNHYYDNTVFHRVIADFMAQGGDPTGTGSGGPGYQFADEVAGFLVFDRPGLLAMANAGPGTNGSQFFITTAPAEHLNYAHTIFGTVLQGQDNVVGIQLRDPSVADAPATTLQTVVIITDPALVTSDYVNPLAAADAEAIVAGLTNMGSEDYLPADLLTGFVAPVVVTTADLAAVAPEAVAELLETNGHQYRVGTTVENTTCNPDYFFESLQYTVDAYASAEAAAAVRTAEALSEWNTADGYTLSESATLPLYVKAEIPGCNDLNAIAGKVYLQRGRYVITVEGIFTTAVIAQVGEDALAQVLVNSVPQLFEPFLTDAYRAELP